MGKALVIKGVDFSENKLCTVEIMDIIPCTGLALSQDTFSPTVIGTTLQLSVVKTPENTTDLVEWYSSDNDIVTIADGLITSVGVGTATITAKCGEQMAICAITSTNTFNANDKFYLNGYEFAGFDLSAIPPKDYLGTYSAATRRIYGDPTNTLSGYKAYTGNNASLGLDVVYPIAIPRGATKISATFPTSFTRYRIALLNANEYPTFGGSHLGSRLIDITPTTNATNGTFEYTLPSSGDYNSFVFMLRTESAGADTVTGDVIITFS